MVGIDVIGYIYSEKEEESGEVILLLHTLPLVIIPTSFSFLVFRWRRGAGGRPTRDLGFRFC